MRTSFMQTKEWVEFKATFGWKYHHIKGLYVLERTLRFGWSFLYAPELVPEQHEKMGSTASEIQAIFGALRKPSTIFARAEFLLPYTEDQHKKLHEAGFIKSRDEVQPEWRQEISLEGTLDSIRTAMKPKGRYNVGLAQKKGVEVREDSSDQAIEEFIRLNEQTKSRQRFQGRSASYLRDLVRVLQENGMGGLWVARYEGQILAGAIIVIWGERASYLYGASSSDMRSVMAPHLLHYTVLAEAKRRGCTLYDLIGVAPPEVERHPWAGISRFKREFGGSTVHYLGSYDRVYRPVLYTAYSRFRKATG